MAFIIKWMIVFLVSEIMVICSKCETKNEEAADYCVKCGAKLEVSRGESWDKRMEKWGEDFGKGAEEWGEDFGKRAEKDMLNVGVLFGLIIGIIMILVGIAWFSGIEVMQYFWPLIIIVFGLLILSGVLYSLIRRR